MAHDRKNVAVLVTGGAGFLGQHIIGLLQSRAHHVTEIRVLDMVPYVNNLDYPDKKPVRQFTGSILDADLVREACTGVDSVLHIASVIDTSLLPDEERSYNINVVGTQNIVDACRQSGVKRLMYCSTMDVVIGRENIYNGTETLAQPKTTLFEPYGTTKTKAERIVLSANGRYKVTTLSIRPAVMYGEQDHTYMCRLIKVCNRIGRYIRFGCKDGKTMHVYVGNVAWCFVSAENTLAIDGGTHATGIGGQAFFVGDDTPKKNMSDLIDIFFKPLGVKPLPVDIPCWLIKLTLYILYFVLTFVSLFHRVNCSVSTAPFDFMIRTYFFSYKKAQILLRYKPLYTFEEAKARTVRFLKTLTRTPELKRN